MKFIIILLTFLLITLQFAEAQSNDILIPYRKGDKWGYSDTSANVVIEPKFEQTFFFGEFNKDIPKIAKVMNNKKVGLINTAGEIKIPIEYDYLYSKSLSKYSKKIMVAQKNGKYGIINYNNKILHPFKYNEIKIDYQFYYEGRKDSLRFYVADSLGYFIIGLNKGKNAITKELYDNMYENEALYGKFQEGENIGNVANEEEYNESFFKDSLVKYHVDSTYTKDSFRQETYIYSKGKVGYYDNRKIFIPPFFDEIIRPEDVVSLVRRDGVDLLIKNNGEVLLEMNELRYYYFNYTREYHFIYLKDYYFKKIGVFDLDSKLLIAPKYDMIIDSYCPNYGLIWRVSKDKKGGYVSPSGVEFFRD